VRPVSELALAHAGRPALVIGGGESAPVQVARAPAGAVVLSANQHGALLTKCDYIVACDNKPGRRYVAPHGLVDLRGFGVPVISPRAEMADYRIFKVPVNSSGCMAAWAAWVMGCAPICLAGMDLYLGKATYFHSPKAKSTGTHVPEDTHAGRWRMLQAAIPGAMLRSLGGPLVGVLPAYDPAEPPAPPPTVIEVLAQARGTMAKILNTGQIVEVGAVELAAGLRRRSMVKVAA
jgi:hypothetical protein